MTPADHLRQVRDLIAVPERWCRDAWAVDENGHRCEALSEDARRWCIQGAIFHFGKCPRMAIDCLDRAAYDMYDDGYMTVNDALGHAAVLRVLDRAIEMAEGGVMADEERICLNCRNGTPDKLEHRTIVCNVLPRILDMPVDCMQYCYGGSVREVECPADFGCNHWTLHPKPEG